MRAMWHLDQPQLAQAAEEGDSLLFSGWVAGSEAVSGFRLGAAFESLRDSVTLQIAERPDVREVLGIPGLLVAGFSGSAPRRDIEQMDCFTIEFDYRGGTEEIVIPVYTGPTHGFGSKPEKLRKLRSILRCPGCKSTELQLADDQLSCPQCSRSFPAGNHYNFLSSSAATHYQPETTDNVSENAYDGEMLNIINRHHAGWILDCGAGRREHYYANVVNFEIVDYPSTDVLGLGESLPFQDHSFDAVFSCAVLEHVRDPFLCADEILRVIKPGGTLYCQVPFLQPFHGYPNHFYNMTAEGLRNLFGDRIDVERLEPLNFGQPIDALNWIVQAYAAGLPLPEREAFLDMSLRDLLKPNTETLLAGHVDKLSEQARQQLACCNLLVARRI